MYEYIYIYVHTHNIYIFTHIHMHNQSHRANRPSRTCSTSNSKAFETSRKLNEHVSRCPICVCVCVCIHTYIDIQMLLKQDV